MTTSISDLRINQNVSRLLYVREQERLLTAERKRLEQDIISLFETDGLTVFETDNDVRVSVEHRPRRSFDLSVLSDHLAPTLVATLIKQDVDSSALDAAVQTGLVPAEVADKATTVAYSTQVRIYGEQGVRGQRS